MIMTLENKVIKKPIRYRCKTCGEFTEIINHLCAPRIVVDDYTCTYCGESTRDPWHVCMSMVDIMQRICDSCPRPVSILETEALSLV